LGDEFIGEKKQKNKKMKTSDFIKREWVFWILILAPTIFAIYYWPVLPDKIPTHWNASGEIDN